MVYRTLQELHTRKSEKWPLVCIVLIICSREWGCNTMSLGTARHDGCGDGAHAVAMETDVTEQQL